MIFELSFLPRSHKFRNHILIFSTICDHKRHTRNCFSFPFWLCSTITTVQSPWTFHATFLSYIFPISQTLLPIPFFIKYSMKALNERWNMELFKLGERLKSCRVKLPLKGSLASWKNLLKLNRGKHRALHLGLSIPTHLCSLVADEPRGFLERLEIVVVIY